MNYHCRSCSEEIRLETGSYPFVRSQILLHLDRCDVTGQFSAQQRMAEASAAADEKFFVTRLSRSDQRRGDDESRRSPDR
jgi:hypothetical protein